MSQFLQVGEELCSEIYVITTLGGKYSLVREGRFIFENCPNPAGLKGGTVPSSFHPMVCPAYSKP